MGRFDNDCWAFVDWVEERKCKRPFDIKKMAVPPVYLETGVATYNSLVYAMALQHAAGLCQSIRRNDTAKREYQTRAKVLIVAVNKTCFDTSKPMYVNGPGVKDLYQHTQNFAILSGCIKGEAAKDLMRRTITSSNIPQCSSAMGFYIFRVADRVGIYKEMFDTLLTSWRTMVKQSLKTWAAF